MDDATKKGEAEDVLDAIGQKNEKEGIKWTKFFHEKWEKEELEKQFIDEETLKKNRKKKDRYFKALAFLMQKKLDELEKPGPGFTINVKTSATGVFVELKDRWGRSYKRGFKPTGTAKYDLNAAVNMIGRVEDTMYDIEDKKQTKSGVYLP